MIKRNLTRWMGFAVGLSILFHLCLTSTATAQDRHAPFYRDSWALLIGVNKYPHLPPESRLNYAVNDIVELKRVLIEEFDFPEDHILTLQDEKATQRNILDELSNLSDQNKIDGNDRVLVFFSGHGQTVALPSGGEMGFLIPYDAKVDLADVENPAQYYRSCIGMDELSRRSVAIPAKHLLFLIDACYSGLAASYTRSIPNDKAFLNTVSKLPVRHIITAGLKGEQVIEKPEWGHGAFTYKLLEALRTGAADWDHNSVTTGDELATYLRLVVPKIAPQTPHHGRFDGEGEFLFVHPDEKPATAPEPEKLDKLSGTGKLLVRTKPMGAKIYVDDKFIAHTPKALKNLPAGERKIRLVLGEKVYETTVTIVKDKTAKLSHSW